MMMCEKEWDPEGAKELVEGALEPKLQEWAAWLALQRE